MSEQLMHYALSRHTHADYTDPHLHHRYDLERELASAQRGGGRRRWKGLGRRGWLSLARATT